MSYPQSPDKKIRKLSRLLTRQAEQEGVEFSFGEQVVYPMEAFAHFGCLSLFLIEAKETYEKVYNGLYTAKELMEGFGKSYGELSLDQMVEEQKYLDSLPKEKVFPIEFHDQEDSTYFGFIPRPSLDVPGDFFLLSHFTVYSVEEYVKKYKMNKMMLVEGRVPLDPLYDKMVRKMNARQIETVPALPMSPNTELDMNSNLGQEGNA